MERSAFGPITATLFSVVASRGRVGTSLLPSADFTLTFLSKVAPWATPSRAIAFAASVHTASLYEICCSGPGGSKWASRIRTLKRFLRRASMSSSVISFWSSAAWACSPTKWSQSTSVPALNTFWTVSSGDFV